MDLVKTIYLSSGTISALDVMGSGQRLKSIGTSVTGQNVMITIPLAPLGVEDSNEINVTAGLLPTGQTWADKHHPDLALRLASNDQEDPYWIDGVTLDFAIPENSDWLKSELVCNLNQAPFAWVEPAIKPGEIPDSKSDVVMVKDWRYSITSALPIPGDRIDVRHIYWAAQQVNRGPAWFHTETFAGGVVVARRAHPTIENLLVYDVAAEDRLLTDILPTDYYLYDIGDDVFPFVAGGQRSALSPSFPAGPFRMAPVALGGRGISWGLSFSDFASYANLRVLVGSIVSMPDPEYLEDWENRADVLLNGLTFTLDIVYRCVSGSTDRCRDAFKKDDTVLVLWSGYRSAVSAADLVVIGHLDDVYPCIIILRGFLCRPSKIDMDYANGDDRTAVLLTNADALTHIAGVWRTDQSLIVAPGHSQENIDAWQSPYLYGNVDWIGSSLTLSWKGPAGRLLPFDRDTSRPGYAVEDEDMLLSTSYTCFSPKIYRGGNVVETLPNWGVAGNVPVKLLGAALLSTRLVVLCNVNYRDILNPIGGTGGFFEILLIKETVIPATNDFETAGWRVLWFRQAGGPTDIWRFNSTGTRAVNAVGDTLTLTVGGGSATFTAHPQDMGTGAEHYAPDGSRSFWNSSRSATKNLYHDYLGTVEKFAAVTYSVSQQSTRVLNYVSAFADIPAAREGALTAPVFTISIVQGIGDPWGLGFGVDSMTSVQPVSCNCVTTDTWTRTGFDLGPCVPGERLTVSVTRTIACVGLPEVSRSATLDLGPAATTGMGWVLIDRVMFSAFTGTECYGHVASNPACDINYIYYSSGETMYREAISAYYCAPGVDCTPTYVAPLDASRTCPASPTYTMHVLMRDQYKWQCLTGVPLEQTHYGQYNNNGPAYVP